jgi:acyl CoA:acetate/3-ketoacid CoA transferase beta subunit
MGQLGSKMKELNASLIFTSCLTGTMGVFLVDMNGADLTLIEIAPGVTVDDIKAKIGAEFKTSPDLA